MEISTTHGAVLSENAGIDRVSRRDLVCQSTGVLSLQVLDPAMRHDRIHAREPTHHIERWSVGTIESVEERDGHCVVTVTDEHGESVELVVTVAIRDLFLSRLDTDEGESPVGEQVWYRKRGGK